MKTEYFESAEVSDVGRKRKNNEDACLRIPERGIFCVADGMGGQAGGDLASEAITTTLQQVFTKAAPEEDATFARRLALFRKATNQASKWIKNFADEKVIGQMGSTVVALIIDPRNPRRAAGLHAGDSRLYRYRNGELKQITADHSAVAALAAKLGRSPESIPAKYQNELLRAVGLTEAVELEKTPVEVISGDVYLICSDGLTKMQTDAQIAKILKDGAQEPLAAVAQNLINAANDAGGKDNVTAVLVKAGDLSGAPTELDADEEEDKTVAAPATPALEAPTPSHYPSPLPAMPDTDDVHGDTPHTPTPHTEDSTPERPTSVRPTTPVPAAVPKPATGNSTAKKDTQLKIKTGLPGETKKSFPVIIVIAVVVLLATGAGIWFAVGSKSKPVTSTDDFPTTPATANPPPVVTTPTKPAPTPAVTNPVPDTAQTALLAAGHETLKNAQAAFDGRDFKNAATLAALALQKLPGDATAVKLQADAQAQLKIQDAWHNALNQAQAAFNNRDYKNAAAWAGEALKKIPNEQAATRLLENAQQQIAAAAALEQKYLTAIAAGQDALKQKNFSLAETKAREALAVRANDPAAAQILAQIQVAMDLESAQRFFRQGDYASAAQFCQSHPTVEDFKQLAASCRTEQTALADAKNFFAAADYSFVARIQGQALARKPPFAELLNQAAGEQKLLADLAALKQAGDWKSAADRLASTALAAVTNKAPFRAIGQWAQAQADAASTQKQLQQLTVTYETMLVWFNVVKPTDACITTADGKKAQRIDGQLPADYRQQCLASVDALTNGFAKLGVLKQNDREKHLAELRDNVNSHP